MKSNFGAVVLLAFCLAAACSSRSAPVTAPQPAPTNGGPVAEAPGPDPAVRELEQRTRELDLRILEKDSQIHALEDRLAAQQRLLDEAIQEVVRAKAKLLSLESRAEAASQMAGTEIALKSLEVQAAGDPDPDLPQIRQLLQMSSKEFENGNFGGALYLTNQAKSRIQTAQMRLRARETLGIGSDEVPFAAPVLLKLTKSGNVREGPEIGSAVLVTLGPGTPVTGYSHKGEWVRVVCDDGTRGWIHQILLSGR